MNRRTLLTQLTVPGTLLVTGCQSEDAEPTTATTTRSPATTADTTATPQTTTTDVPTTTDVAAPASIVDTNVFFDEPVVDSEYGAVPWLRVDVRNPSPILHGPVEINNWFYGENETGLHVRTTGTAIIPPDHTWRYYVSLENANPGAVTDTTVNPASIDPPIAAPIMSAVEILTRDVSASNRFVEVRATLNVEAVDTAEGVVITTLYDSESYFRGSLTHSTSFRSDQVMVSIQKEIQHPPTVATPITRAEFLFFDGHP